MGDTATARLSDSREGTPGLEIDLLPVFRLHRAGTAVEVPAAGQRLLAFLAMHGHHVVRRAHAAGTLWRGTTDSKAGANLRSTLWRIRRVARDAIDVSPDGLNLAGSVAVDVLTYLEAARGEQSSGPDTGAQVDAFSSELLEDWYDGWLVDHRERWRLTRLCALERIAVEACGRGRYDTAVEAAFAAITAEPLRESAHAALIESHLAVGNVWEAVRHYDAFTALLREELGIRPSRQLHARVHDAMAAQAVTAR